MSLAMAFDEARWLSLADQFAAQADRTPDAVALAAEAGDISYAELAARTNQLARYLMGRGVGADCVVPVLLDRSVEMIVATLAVLAAGGAYMPIDAEAPPARVATQLRDSAAGLMLTSRALAARATTPGGVEVLCLDDATFAAACARLSARPISDLERGAPIRPEHLCYVVYTSGSTGEPKGAGNTQAGIVNCLRWLSAEMALTPYERVLQLTAYVFDISVLEIFLPLVNGGALVLAPGGQRDMDYVAGLIQAQAVSFACFVPNMLQEFLKAEPASRCTSLRRLLVGGEVLSGYVQAMCHERLPGATLWNMYGPCEAAVAVTLWRCRRDAGGGGVPIGHASWNTQLHILDEAGRPVPDGTPGELHITGVHLGRGYLRRPELTAEKFVACPFGPPGGRMYRTGDIVERRPDGALLFHGRRDSQIKLNGNRIELGEIEAVLATLPSIARGAVIARELSGETRLVAYLIAAAEAERMSAADLRGALARTLPRCMIPSHFVYMDQFPTTLGGKLLARALPDPTIDVAQASASQFGDGLEALLAELFARLTGAQRVGPDQDFFDLGGTSFTAMRLAAQLKQATGLALPMRLLLEHPTPAGLAGALHRAGGEGGGSKGSAAKGRPLVFVFGGSGGHCLRLGTLCLASAKGLDLRVIDYPIWRSLRGRAGFDRMIEALAWEVAACAPTGPLQLVGYSLGGAVAYGVALELVRMGRQVAFVGLLDALAPIVPPEPRERPVAMLRRRLSAFSRLWREHGAIRLGLLYAPVGLLALASDLAQLVPTVDRYEVDYRFGVHAMRALHWRWRSDRRRLSERLAAPMVLFRVRGAVDDESVWAGWSGRAERFESVTVDGDHWTMLEPVHIQDLVEKLERAVRVQAGGEGALHAAR